MKAFTDYPIVELGDIANEKAPIRECAVVGWDGDKYCTVVVGSMLMEKQIKAGYLYTSAGRQGLVETIDVTNLPHIKS